MKPFYRDFRLAIIVAVTAFGSCWLIGKSSVWHQPTHSHNPHQWLHQQLELTAEQDIKLHPIEQRFNARKKELEAAIMVANRELAKAINEDGRYSQRVKQAADKIHVAQGELQKATLKHLFEMQTVLTPEQVKKLNKLATNALTHNH